MNITEVKVVLADNTKSKLLGYASITIENAFAVHDIRIISGNSGAFVAMPSKPTSVYCSACSRKNNAVSKFCAECGEKLIPTTKPEDPGQKARSHIDIAHPINAKCRDLVESIVLGEYSKQFALAKNRAAADCRNGTVQKAAS